MSASGHSGGLRHRARPPRTGIAILSALTLAAPLAAGVVDPIPENPCDADFNGDFVVDGADLGIMIGLWGTDAAGADFDGSGIIDGGDLGHLLASWGPCPVQFDCDGDGMEDATAIEMGLAEDCNGNLTPDSCEDCDGDGIADSCAIAGGAPDCNGDGLPDACEPDCNGNGIPDACEIADGLAEDCNGNGIPDGCDVVLDPDEDCDGNGLLDDCELAAGTAIDCDEDGVLDACEADCNGNGVPDSCDIASGAADCDGDGIPDECEADCDGNGMPDECELAADPALDCNENGVLDACDLLAGASFDTNANGLPDECEAILAGPWDAIRTVPVDDDEVVPVVLDFALMAIPADFFAPGSEPFLEAVPLAGVPIAPELYGDASLLIVRSADPFLPREAPGPDAHAVSARLARLRLHNMLPLRVATPEGEQLWDLEVVPLPSQIDGVLTAVKTTPEGGLCDLTLPASVRLFFRQRAASEVRFMDVDFELLVTGAPWTHEPHPDLAVVDDPASSFTLAVGDEVVQPTALVNIQEIGGRFAAAVVRALKYTVRMDIHNGLENRSGGQKIDSGRDFSEGAVTVANLNDTNGDGTKDRDQAEVKATANGVDEVDLMKLVVKAPPVNDGGKVTLTKVGGDFKLWGMSTKKDEITLPVDIAVGDLPKTYWIEARAASAALRDIHLRSTYKEATYNVRATGVWAEFTAVKIKRAVAGADNAIFADCEGDAKAIVDDFVAVDKSRYGYGAFEVDDKGTANPADDTDKRYGGRLLLEFKTSPDKAEDLGVVWDLSRRIELRYLDLAVGSGTLVDSSKVSKKKFPKLEEEPNDDGGSTDETNTPKNRHIYVYDGPSTSIGAGGAYFVSRMNFKEFARVQLAGVAFANDNGTIEGSRASDYKPWHHLRYLRWASGRNWSDDDFTKKASFSGIRRVAAGNGAATLKLGADPKTEGFTATYNGTTKKWTLKGTSGDPDVEAAAVAVLGKNRWTLTFGKRVTMTITEGATAFADGDELSFSIFKSKADKKGLIAEGATTVNDED